MGHGLFIGRPQEVVMPNLLIIDPQDTPNIGRYKINYNFSILVFSSFTGIAASIFTNPNPTTVTVGGIPAGTTFPTDQYLQGMMDLLLYPAITPNFTSFLITSQATTLEVGAAVTGSKTFTWTIANTADLLANSIGIEDTTNATSLATGLGDDGSETIFLSSVAKSVPDYNVWTISAQDTDTTVFTRTYTIEWRYASFYGISASLTLNSAAIVALTGTSLVTDVSGSYSLAGSGYGYLCVPASFSVPNGFRNSVTNLPIEMAGTSEGYTSFDGAFFYDPVSVTRNGIPITYRVYRTKYSITTTTMNVSVTGGTAATLQSVINAGNIATGSAAILGNFSATTYFSGNTPLSTILSNYFVGTNTFVQPGVNITTGGTPNAPVINVVSSPLFTSVSAMTFYSAGTDLNAILSGSALVTYVQPGLNITTGGTPTNPIINTLGSPTFTAITASSVFATNLSGATLYSGNTLLQNALTLQTVVNAGNTAERSIYLQGDGSSGTLLRKVIFHDTDSGYSGTSDPSIGIDYNIIGSGAQLLLESPDTIYQITKNPIAPATTYPSLIPNFYFGEDTGTAPAIWMGFLSAFTNVGRVYNYIRISEKDVTNGYGGEVLLTATGTSTASYGQYIANFPAKSGTVAMLSDVAIGGGSTFVQPGLNITTGGTVGSPIVNLAGSISLTAITATTYYSGSTPLLDTITLQSVTNAGNSTNNDIYQHLNGDVFGTKGVYFKELDISLSGSSDAFVGVDYNFTFTPSLALKSPDLVNIVTDRPVYPLVAGIQGSVALWSVPNNGTVLSLGCASAGTEISNFITLSSYDAISGVVGRLTLAASGLTGYYLLNFPSKNGTIATLDDILTGATSTYVQPGLNITTGGTATNPVVGLATSIFLTGVTTNYLSATSISAATYFSGVTPIENIFSLSAHTHVSAHITDSSYGGNGVADLDKLVKFGPYGNLQAISTASSPTAALYAQSNSLLSGPAIEGLSTDSAPAGKFTNTNGGYALDTQANDSASAHISNDSVGQPAMHVENYDATNQGNILWLHNVDNEGVIVLNNGGLLWTSPTGSGTTRTNLGLSNVFVAPGTNTYTSSTVFNTIVGVVGSPVFTGVTAQFVSGTSISGTNFYSGSTSFNTILSNLNSNPTAYVQPGLNITTGGTQSAPIVNLAGSIVITGVTATSISGTSISATTFSSGATELSIALSNKFNSAYAPISVQNQWVQLGNNTTTGGTPNAPSIGLVASPSVLNLIASGTSYGATVSGSTIYEGSSLLSEKYAPKNLTTTLNSGIYILQLTDNSKLVDLSGASAQNLVVPRNSSVALPIGAQVMVAQTGAGQVTFSADTGVSILSYLSMTKIIGQYGVASLVKKDSNVWVLGGALTA